MAVRSTSTKSLRASKSKAASHQYEDAFYRCDDLVITAPVGAAEYAAENGIKLNLI